jgi:hypothetical protein
MTAVEAPPRPTCGPGTDGATGNAGGAEAELPLKPLGGMKFALLGYIPKVGLSVS